MINQRIEALRKNMQAKGLDAVILPSNDPHQSEYVCDHWKVREYFSGFTGSAGTLVITQEHAALWTDSRYFLQVEQQCADSEVELYKQSIPHAPEHVEWLADVLDNGNTIGVDYRLTAVSQHEHLVKFARPQNIAIKDMGNLVDEVWSDRPSLPNTPVIDHDVVYCGSSREEKIAEVRAILDQKNADYLLISALDEVAWLFNIRAADIDFTPLPISYALVGHSDCMLFADRNRFDEQLLTDLQSASVQVIDYAQTFEFLATIKGLHTVLTDGANLNYAAASVIQGQVELMPSYIRQAKAIKNPIEIAHTRQAMIKDGIALVQFFIWLEDELEERTLTEVEIGQALEKSRSFQEGYMGESFAAIVGYKSNGAIIHYKAEEATCATVEKDGILLIDSGAQYINGTTDITRTIALSEPTATQKRDYTLVLKGHIALDRIHFPKGTVGMQLDSLARMHLWQHNLNYGHGTGHGIGFFSLVHEPPQGFATSGVTSRGVTPIVPNMLTTNEPGFYKRGEYGIRIENVLLSVEKETNEFGEFYGFEALTLCPIDTTLIDMELMDKHEIQWLNDYHQKVLDTLSPYLMEFEVEWLAEKCKQLA